MTPEQKTTAAEMRAIGAPDTAIAQSLGVSRQTINNALGKRPKAPRNGVAPVGVTHARFAAELRAWRARMGLSQSQAARALRCKTQSISFWETERNGCALADSMLLLMRHIEAERVRHGAAR